MASLEVKEMLAAAAAACEDKKAEDIRILALDPAESGLTDYFLICTGTNDRQTVAITDAIELQMKRDFGTLPNAVEGRAQGEWILMDYVDFIVHVFLPEKRAFYGLERLRKSATTLNVADLNTEITATIKAKRPATRKTAATGKGKQGSGSAAKKRATAAKSPGKKAAARTAAAKPPKQEPPKQEPKTRAVAKRSAKKTAGSELG